MGNFRGVPTITAFPSVSALTPAFASWPWFCIAWCASGLRLLATMPRQKAPWRNWERFNAKAWPSTRGCRFQASPISTASRPTCWRRWTSESPCRMRNWACHVRTGHGWIRDWWCLPIWQLGLDRLSGHDALTSSITHHRESMQSSGMRQVNTWRRSDPHTGGTSEIEFAVKCS